MIFLRPNNIFEFLFQSLINTIFRLRQSVKKRFIQKVENNIFISGEFFEKISKKNSNIVFSSLDNFFVIIFIIWIITPTHIFGNDFGF